MQKIIRGYQMLCLVLLLNACQKDSSISEDKVNDWLDQWHLLAAKADTSYFEYLDTAGIYIGTDPEEVWSTNEFKSFAMPYFARGKAWDFKNIHRNVYTDASGLVWFDELLDTWMGKCRASGVIDCRTSNWKIKHYQLSMAIPNSLTKKVIQLADTEYLLQDTMRRISENVVAQQLKTYNNKDIEGFINTFHPRAELFAFDDKKARASGREEIQSLYEDLFKKSPQLNSKLLNRIVMQNRVIDHEYITGRNGSTVPLELTMIYELDSGLIRKAWSIR